MKLFFTIFTLFLFSCSSDVNSREFSFSYSVDIEPSNNKKLEMWLPVPQSNSVQEISNVSIDSDGLSYEFKEEKDHNNKYVYI